VKKLLVAGIAAAAFCGAPALAADTPVKSPPAAPMFNWTGFYAGVNAGAGWISWKETTFVDPNAGNYIGAGNSAAVSAAGTGTRDTSAFTGGIQAGFNRQINNLVYGLEADFNYLGKSASTINGTYTTAAFAGQPFTIMSSLHSTWLATVRPRLGMTFDHLLLYVTGGLAVTDRRYSFNFSDFNGATASLSRSGTQAGWTLGGGAEYALGNAWSVKGEYLFAQFDGTQTANGLIVFNPVNFKGITVGTNSSNIQVVRLGLNYKY
jgi:outer membrane immunogenic protein